MLTRPLQFVGSIFGLVVHLLALERDNDAVLCRAQRPCWRVRRPYGSWASVTVMQPLTTRQQMYKRAAP